MLINALDNAAEFNKIKESLDKLFNHPNTQIIAEQGKWLGLE